MSTDQIPRSAVFRDRRRVDDIAEVTPGLPVPTLTAARATFDYRHVVHAEDAREAVSCAAEILGHAFGIGTFAERTEMAGDDTPRHILEALLPSGLTLVIVSRVTVDLDSPAERELAEVAA